MSSQSSSAVHVNVSVNVNDRLLGPVLILAAIALGSAAGAWLALFTLAKALA